jgi:hypothetical protein
MAPTDDQRIAQALNVLHRCLRTFIEERMRGEYNDGWLEKARLSLPDSPTARAGSVTLDVQALIRIATDRRHQILYNALSPRERNFLHELRDVRNRHAHQNEFEERDVERALDTLELFLKAIQSPEAAGIALLRRPPTPATQQTPAMLKPAAPVGPVVKSGQLGAGATGVQRGVRLFRYLAEQANRGNVVGIAYSDFVAFLHGKGSFRDVAGRNYLPGDSPEVIELAWSVTEANGGRIAVTAGERTIRSGMDTFIWASRPPYDRPEKAFRNPKGTLPYTREDWKAVFPDGLRRMIKPGELARLA